MAKSKKASANDEVVIRNKIKRLAITALFSDNELMNRLVLKGGNALDLVHGISSRASVDIDFSIAGDFDSSQRANLRARLEKLLVNTFALDGYYVFDVKCAEVPEGLSPDLADFWGGYGVDFKIIETAKLRLLGSDIEILRRNAITLGQSTKFSIDISKHEFTGGKVAADIEGYRVFVYTPEMIVCEKLRALCQQMIEYGSIVRRTRSASSRARDFVDIYTVMNHKSVDMKSAAIRQLMFDIFSAKRVDPKLLRNLNSYRDFHFRSFPSVCATVKPGVVLESFDYYFDFVLDLIHELEPLGDE